MQTLQFNRLKAEFLKEAREFRHFLERLELNPYLKKLELANNWVEFMEGFVNLERWIFRCQNKFLVEAKLNIQQSLSENSKFFEKIIINDKLVGKLNFILTKYVNFFIIDLTEFLKLYDLCLMSDLPENNLQKAEKHKLYLDEDGNYVVIVPSGELIQASLKNENINLENLSEKLKDNDFRKSIFDITSKQKHTKLSFFSTEEQLSFYKIEPKRDYISHILALYNKFITNQTQDDNKELTKQIKKIILVTLIKFAFSETDNTIPSFISRLDEVLTNKKFNLGLSLNFAEDKQSWSVTTGGSDPNQAYAVSSMQNQIPNPNQRLVEINNIAGNIRQQFNPIAEATWLAIQNVTPGDGTSSNIEITLLIKETDVLDIDKHMREFAEDLHSFSLQACAGAIFLGKEGIFKYMPWQLAILHELVHVLNNANGNNRANVAQQFRAHLRPEWINAEEFMATMGGLDSEYVFARSLEHTPRLPYTVWMVWLPALEFKNKSQPLLQKSISELIKQQQELYLQAKKAHEEAPVPARENPRLNCIIL